MKLCPCCKKYMGCEHCGSIIVALTDWPIEVHMTCPCMCHERWLADQEDKKKNKKKKKK